MHDRMLRAELFRDEALGALGPDAIVLFEGLWCMANHYGCLPDRPNIIYGEIFMVIPSVSRERCAELLDALVTAGMVERYYGDGGTAYLWIRRFLRHQKLDFLVEPSYPMPPRLQSEVEELRERMPAGRGGKRQSDPSLVVSRKSPETPGDSRNVPETPAQSKAKQSKGKESKAAPLAGEWRAAALAVLGRDTLTTDEAVDLIDLQSRYDLDAFEWALARAKQKAKRQSAIIAYAKTCIADAPKDTHRDDSPGLDAYPTPEELDAWNAEYERIHYGTNGTAPAQTGHGTAAAADGPGDGTLVGARAAGRTGRLPANRRPREPD